MIMMANDDEMLMTTIHSLLVLITRRGDVRLVRSSTRLGCRPVQRDSLERKQGAL